MASEALAHGPWALLNSADLMRLFLNDIAKALEEVHNNSASSQGGVPLFGKYIPRNAQPAHSRPLPLPDALLHNIQASSQRDDAQWAWISDVATGPWLWKLQFVTLAILMISPEFRTMLQATCPKNVFKTWMASLEERLTLKILGVSTEKGFPQESAALTPIMVVVTELMLLRHTYEMP